MYGGTWFVDTLSCYSSKMLSKIFCGIIFLISVWCNMLNDIYSLDYLLRMQDEKKYDILLDVIG